MARLVKEFRAGNVRANLWQNEVQKEGKVSITDSIRIERKYRDKRGIWKSNVF